MVNIDGMMVDFIKVNLSLKRCKDEVFLFGLTGADMKVSIKKTKNMDKVYLYGPMVKNILVNFKMGPSMEKDKCYMQTDKQNMEPGRMVK